jgi:hypothetical protein
MFILASHQFNVSEILLLVENILFSVAIHVGKPHGMMEYSYILIEAKPLVEKPEKKAQHIHPAGS